MIGAIILAHLVGDYLLQTDWMAQEKTRRWAPALAHAGTYGLPFLVITRSPLALAVIVGTHAVVDRYRLAKHVCWAKNQLAPASHRYPWREGRATGYRDDAPMWMTVWLMIIADNTLHLLINVAAVRWL
jgi:hypothetical protein